MLSKLFNKNKHPEFIVDRVARRDEVKYGFFSVVTDQGEEISVPYNVQIPQEVVHVNNETKQRNKGILIQSELITKTQMKDKIICSVKLESGSILHCFIDELELKKI